MTDFLSYLDFAMDIVCLMPPIDKVEAILLTQEQSIRIAMGTLGFLLGAVIAASTKRMFPNNSAFGVVLAICVTAIGLIGMEQGTLRGIFLTAYPPMVVALRFGEGATIGARASSYLRWWHVILFLAVIGGIYYVLKPLPTGALAAVKGVWALFGVLLTSTLWTRKLSGDPLFGSALCRIGVFAVLSSTLVYVSTSPFERSIYQWALPAGLLIGIIGRRITPRV